MDGKSLNIANDKLEQLKLILPEAFTEGKVDWEKLRLALGEDINVQDERYILNWAGKSDAFRALQTPTTATLTPARDESVNFDTTENIFIEGENLEVLKILQKSYYGKIKMIYIDPPYNTGSDSFVYPDKFSESREEYLKRIQAKDEDGQILKEEMLRPNSKDSGHYHSNWLSMMYPRLFLAKNLLSEDGVIFISIDDNEVHNLRLLLNDVFGEENFVGQAIWKNATDNNPTQIATEHEYILCYARNKDVCNSVWKSAVSAVKDRLIEIGDELIAKFDDLEALQAEYSIWFRQNKAYLGPLDRYKYIDFDGVYTGSQSVHNPGKEGYRYDVPHPKTGKPCKQPLMGYRFPEETMLKLLEEGKVLFGDDEDKIIELKVYAKDYLDKLSSVIDLDGRLGSYDLRALFPEVSRIFNNPKPVSFLNTFFPFILEENDIVLDFFSGSCSTAQVIFNLNLGDDQKRKFILVQYPETLDPQKKEHKVGYDFCIANGFPPNIAEIGKERIRRVIQKIKEDNPMFAEQNVDLGFKVYKLKHSNFKLWRGDGIENADELVEQLDFLNDPVREDAVEENMFTELILKSGYPLTASVEKQDVGASHYFLVSGELAVALGELGENLIQDVIQRKAQQLICLDRSFADNDQLKTNTQLQLKDAGIAFHSI